MSKQHLTETCPLCDHEYEGQHYWTRHHIFPKFWYEGNVTVEVCHTCHQLEFHRMFPMGNKIWIPSVCVQNWVKFCKSKGKNAYHIYPQLCKIEPIY